MSGSPDRIATMSAITRQTVGPFTVNVWSKGTGTPLLFLHGYERHPGGASFLERLAERHLVYAPEQPGYGTSTGFEHVDNLLDLVLFYRALIASWGVERIDVVGHSTGGMMAAELAVVAPNLVRRLVLVDAFGLWIDDEPATDPFGQASKVLAAKWHDPAARPDPEPTIYVADPADPHGAVMFEAQNRATATKFMWPIAERGLRRRLRYVDAPTLVVHGASDGLLPMAYAEQLTGLIDGAELVRIADAGHYPMIEREDVFVDVVSTFLPGDEP
jgi:pimeloyl-ACP methyl ester carboxylesterase